VDPLEWQISQDTANGIAACLANTIGAAESVLRVAATGHDKRLFFKVIIQQLRNYTYNMHDLCYMRKAPFTHVLSALHDLVSMYHLCCILNFKVVS